MRRVSLETLLDAHRGAPGPRDAVWAVLGAILNHMRELQRIHREALTLVVATCLANLAASIRWALGVSPQAQRPILLAWAAIVALSIVALARLRTLSRRRRTLRAQVRKLTSVYRALCR